MGAASRMLKSSGHRNFMAPHERACPQWQRFARARIGRYGLIDFVVLLIGKVVCGEQTLLAFLRTVRSPQPRRSWLCLVEIGSDRKCDVTRCTVTSASLLRYSPLSFWEN